MSSCCGQLSPKGLYTYLLFPDPKTKKKLMTYYRRDADSRQLAAVTDGLVAGFSGQSGSAAGGDQRPFKEHPRA